MFCKILDLPHARQAARSGCGSQQRHHPPAIPRDPPSIHTSSCGYVPPRTGTNGSQLFPHRWHRLTPARRRPAGSDSDRPRLLSLVRLVTLRHQIPYPATGESRSRMAVASVPDLPLRVPALPCARARSTSTHTPLSLLKSPAQVAEMKQMTHSHGENGGERHRNQPTKPLSCWPAAGGAAVSSWADTNSAIGHDGYSSGWPVAAVDAGGVQPFRGGG